MRRNLLVLVVLPLLFLPGRAVAAGAGEADPHEAPAPKLREIERGLWFGLESGGLFLFGPDSRAGSSHAALARTLELSVGLDLTPRWSVAALAMGAFVSPSDLYLSPTGQRGDFSALLLGGYLRGALWQSSRLSLWGRAGLGVATVSPSTFFRQTDVVAFGGLGGEYFTHLRHFSLGVDLDLMMGFRDLGPGLKLAPFVRYTF